jgi:mono/diheme cytochrome c family protein
MRCKVHRLVNTLAWLFALALLAGCQQKMAKQPSYKPLEETSFFPDGIVARRLVPGTVPRGYLRTDLALFTGRITPVDINWTVPVPLVSQAHSGLLGSTALAAVVQLDYVDNFPYPVTRDVLRHGQDRYMIYCVVCHDPLGTGHGKIVERGYTPPPSYHIERLRHVPVGYIFEVMTLGYGSMPSYGEQIPPRDRWAIVAYIRALQLSQHFAKSDLTPAMRQQWDRTQSSQPQRGQHP